MSYKPGQKIANSEYEITKIIFDGSIYRVRKTNNEEDLIENKE